MKTRTAVAPAGNPKAPYVIVGEQPNLYEVRRGRLGVGDVGDTMNNCLDFALILKSELYITNFIKDNDNPLYHYIVKPKKDRAYLTKSGEYYLNYLKKELLNSPAKVIVAAGNAALFALTGCWGVHKWRGSVLKCDLFPGKKVVPIYPFWTVKNQYLNNLLINNDLKKVREISEGLYIPTHRDIIINPSFREVEEFISMLYKKGLEGETIGYDIECNNYNKKSVEAGLHSQVTCISLAINLQSMSIPFVDGKGEYFTAVQETEVWRMIAMLLENPEIRKVAQNTIFDTQFLFRRYGIKCTNIDDTMMAQHILMPGYMKRLDFITSIWTDHPYYKDDGKEFLGGGSSWNRFFTYNATDSIICTESFPKQVHQLKQMKNYEIYKEQAKLIEPLTYMMERGIKCDSSAMRKEYLKLELEESNLQDEIDEEVGFHCNPRSPKAMKEYFVDTLRLKAYRKKVAGKSKETFDVDALKRYARRGYKVASKMLKVRRLRKIYSTYLKIDKIDSDGRMRCQFDPSGTDWSRLASRESIFKTGMNLQNWPKNIRRFMSPDDGYVYYPIDLSQAENRIVAYVGKIHSMMKAFETGKDVHELTSRLLLAQLFSPEVAREMDVREKSPMGDGTHNWRQWGKKANHGFNYDWGYKAFSLKNEISEKDGKLIYDGYHNAYPDLQERYHRGVQRKLRHNRTLENLMGRRTTFYDRLNDSTFKKAYACIPQGTVGDIINQRGLNYIYYNPSDFSPIELLIQIHDEIGMQIPLSLPFEEHAKMLKKICKNLETPLTTDYGLDFVIPASLTIATTLNTVDPEYGGDGIEIGENIPEYGDEELGKILSEKWEMLNART